MAVEKQIACIINEEEAATEPESEYIEAENLFRALREEHKSETNNWIKSLLSAP